MTRPKPRACRDPARWPRTPIPAIAPSTDRRPKSPSWTPPRLSRGAARTPTGIAYPVFNSFHISAFAVKSMKTFRYSRDGPTPDVPPRPRSIATPTIAAEREAAGRARSHPTLGIPPATPASPPARSRTARSWCSEERLCSECGLRQRLFHFSIRSSDQTESGLIRKAAQQSASDGRFFPAHLRPAECPVHLIPPNAAERSWRSGMPPVPSCSRPGSTPVTTPQSSPDARSTSTRPLGEP